MVTAEAIESLARALADMPRVPLDDQLWSAADVAAYLGIALRTAEDLKYRADFPTAIRVTASDRWIAREVIDWAKRQRAKLPKGRKAA